LIPFGTVPFQVGPTKQIVPGLGAVLFADRRKGICAVIDDLIGEEAIAESGTCTTDRLLVERHKPAPYTVSWLGHVTKRSEEFDIVVQHADVSRRRGGKNAAEATGLRHLGEAARRFELLTNAQPQM